MKDATEAVFSFLKQPDIDLEAWRNNLPISGIAELDILKLHMTIEGFALRGTKNPIQSPKTEEDHLGRFAASLVRAAIQNVDWGQILALWEDSEKAKPSANTES